MGMKNKEYEKRLRCIQTYTLSRNQFEIEKSIYYS